MAAAKIAVVNDDTSYLQLMDELLTEEGYSVQRFHEAGGAYEGTRRQDPDAIILDIRMEHPESGWQLLELFKLDRCLTKKPIIVCSADVPALRERSAYLLSKGCTVLPKPFDLDDLLTLLRRLLSAPDEGSGASAEQE
jgi:DNA-binding response OmpR family regulator